MAHERASDPFVVSTAVGVELFVLSSLEPRAFNSSEREKVSDTGAILSSSSSNPRSRRLRATNVPLHPFNGAKSEKPQKRKGLIKGKVPVR